MQNYVYSLLKMKAEKEFISSKIFEKRSPNCFWDLFSIPTEKNDPSAFRAQSLSLHYKISD